MANPSFYLTTLNEIIKQTFYSASDYDFIKTLTGIKRKEYMKIKKELSSERIYFKHLAYRYYQVRGKEISLFRYEKWNKLIYYLIRAKKPEIIVETGVFDGITTSFFLKALEKNNKGHLYSIDLPAYNTIDGSTHRMDFTTLPRGMEPGWIIPEKLRKRWTLYKGASKDYLEPLLKEHGKIDFFLHDSLHTYENMIFEYEVAWPYLIEDGIMASDDILWNPSFYDFSKKVKRKYLSKYRFGAMKK